MKRIWLASMLSAGCLALAGCEFDPVAWAESDRYKEEFTQEHKLASGGRVSIEGFNGSIDVTGWDRDVVSISGSKYASRESVMKDIKIDVVSDPNSLRVRAIRPIENNCNCGVRYSVKVPRKAILENIATSNGSVRAESLDAEAHLKTSNGGIKVFDLKGSLDAHTSNATVELVKYQGAATVKTSNGSIKAEGLKGSIDGATSNGSVNVSISEPDSRPAVLRTSNASITLEMDAWKNSDIKATTSNGSVNLKLPSSVNAELRASTSNGQITTDYEITTSRFSKNNIAGKIGSGGALIDISTSNGNVRLLKR